MMMRLVVARKRATENEAVCLVKQQPQARMQAVDRRVS